MINSKVNIYKPHVKVLHSCKLLYAAFGSVSEERGKDVSPTCEQLQCAVVKGEMNQTPDGADVEEPDGWPARGAEVIILDGPSSTSYRIGFEDLVVQLHNRQGRPGETATETKVQCSSAPYVYWIFSCRN